MSLLGNILWLIFGGLIAGVGYIIGGLLFCLTIIGITLGRALSEPVTMLKYPS